jgi:hypothetical protein
MKKAITPRKISPQKSRTLSIPQSSIHLILPQQFLRLCHLMELTPETLLQDFAQNLSCGSWKREGREEAWAHLLNYFIAHGYGRHLYTNAEIQQLFKEMDALGLLFPYNGNIRLVKQYPAWRTKHNRYWFKKWQRRVHGKTL